MNETDQTDLNNDILVEEYHIQGEVAISDLMKKYFTPIDITITTVGDSKPSPALDKHKKQREQFRVVSVKYHLKYREIDEDNVIYLDDYNVYELISSLLFKKRFDELSEDDSARVNSFFIELAQLSILYIADYWDLYYSKYDEKITKDGYNEDIEEILLIKQLLDKWENINDVELYLRKKDKFGSVIASETQNIKDQELKAVLEPYVKSKYYNFIQTYNLSKFISEEELKELNSFKTEITKKENLTSFVSEAIAILHFKDNVNPSFSFSYFEQLYNLVHGNTDFGSRLTPIYEFLKILVPPLNRFIEDHVVKGFKKKDKHMLLFAMLRAFSFVPDKCGFKLEGDTDKKEDFIKQLLR